MKHLILLMILIISCPVFAQNPTGYKNDSLYTRTIFFSFGSGFPEIVSFKMGYQINLEWSVSAKTSMYYNDVGGEWNFGTSLLGIKLTKYFNPTQKLLFIVNNVSLDLSYAKDGSYENKAIEIACGFEPLERGIFNPYWAICLTAIKIGDNKLFFTPGLKLGYNLNF